MHKITSYPLIFPESYIRTVNPIKSGFKTSLKNARDGIYKELEKMGVNSSEVIISSNVPLQQNNTGLMKATYPKLEDHGVAVYFSKDYKFYVFCCDKYNRIEDNLQAIRKTIEALRGVERWGVSNFMEKALAGYLVGKISL